MNKKRLNEIITGDGENILETVASARASHRRQARSANNKEIRAVPKNTNFEKIEDLKKFKPMLQ